MNLNKVMIAGNMTRDCEMRYTPTGMALANIGVAVNRKYKDKKTNEMKEEVTFVDVTIWGKTAEFVNTHFSKGSAIFIEGRLKLDTWDDKTTGQKRSKLNVVAENVQFVGGKGGGKSSAKSTAASQQPAEVGAASGEADEENIPF